MKKKILFVVALFVHIQSFGQTFLQTGEREFTQEIEENSTFTRFKETNYATLKDSVDLSNLMPPAGNQGSKGSCWAWATTYIIRTFIDNNPNYLIGDRLNPNSVYSPEYVYQVYKGNKYDCQWSAYSFEILKKVLNDGAVRHSDFPYDENLCNNQPNISLKNRAKQFSLKGYSVELIHDLYSVKKVLSDGFPLVISIKLDDYFCTEGNITSKKPFWNKYHNRVGSHAMVVVGYNDKLQALKVLNSWGDKFGDKGYVWISYSIANSAMNYYCYPKIDESSAVVLQKPKERLNDRSSHWPQLDRLVAWFKSGYYHEFANHRIGLAGVDKDTKIAAIEISDSRGEVKNSFFVDERASKEFFLDGKRYQFTFDNLGTAGYNPFKKAVYFTIENTSMIQN